MDRTAVARLVRRRELVEVLRGVYVDHTGPTSWQQRAWAAVLWAWPAALAGQSAWRAFEGPGRRSREVERLHVVVERHRRLTAPPGIVLHRRSGFADRVLWNLGPPRVRLEEAVLDVALAAAAGGRRTTSARLRAALDGRPWVPRRALIGAVLDDVEAGSCSVLEREYLARVERPHGLPVGRRQARAEHRGRTMWQDVAYEEWGLVVELDGRFDHVVMTDRDRDLDRDLATAAAGGQTLRLEYGQVLSRSCATADRVARVLASRGWSGATQRCGKCGAPDQPG